MIPIHILRLRDANRVGGPEKTILDTALEIDSAKFRFTIASFVQKNHSSNELLEQSRKLGISTCALVAKENNYISEILNLSTIFRKYSINILHAHDYRSRFIGYWAARMTRIPAVTTLHGWIQNAPKEAFYAAFDRLVLRYYKRIIVVSQDLECKLISYGFPREKIFLLHNAIDGKIPHTRVRSSIHEILGLDRDTKLVGSIGRLSQEKGLEDLIRATPRILSQHPKTKILIIGEGPERNKLECMVSNKGMREDILFLGFVSNMDELYQDIDLVVLSSYTEGLPKVLLEALRHGKPVVATNVGGVPEIILPGQTGVLVAPHSPEALARAICDLLHDPVKARYLGERGMELIRKCFSLKTRTRKLEDLYQSVIGNY